ncbi:MAG: type VI secretion system baseplate subunit TssK [Nocardioides sp.]
MKVAEIYRDASGALAVRQEYIPPIAPHRRVAVADGAPAAAPRADGRRSSARSPRSSASATTRSSRCARATSRTSCKFYTINAFLPIVNHLIERADTPPEDAYLLLSQFAGQLASFAVDADPDQAPEVLLHRPGDHLRRAHRGDHPAAQRSSSSDALRRRCRLESREDGLHFGRLDDERLIARRARTSSRCAPISPSSRRRSRSRRSRRSPSWGNIADIVASRRSRACPSRSTYRPPSEIPRAAPGTLYFVLQQTGQYWQNVEGERTIAIYLPPPYDPSQHQARTPRDPAGRRGRAVTPHSRARRTQRTWTESTSSPRTVSTS